MAQDIRRFGKGSARRLCRQLRGWRLRRAGKGLTGTAMEPVQEEANRTAKEIEHDRPAADHLVVARAGEEAAFSWQLHLRNQADDVVRVLRSDPNEQMLRLLATLVTKRTGWPLREASGGE